MSWHPEAALAFDRHKHDLNEPVKDTHLGYSEVMTLEGVADYLTPAGGHLSAAGWDLGDWLRAEDNSSKRAEAHYNYKKEATMQTNTSTISGTLLGQALGTTATGKAKAEAIITPHGETGDLRLTPAGTLKVQTTDACLIDMMQQANVGDVSATIELVEFLSDSGDLVAFNRLHHIEQA